MLGKPVIRGTRTSVERLLAKLRDGMTQEDLLDAYPRLTQGDIEAAIHHRSESIAEQPMTDRDPSFTITGCEPGANHTN